MIRNHLSGLLRRLRLIYTFDLVRYFFQRLKNTRLNQRFLREHPGILLPPDYLMYESFQLNYDEYFNASRDTASWLAGLFRKHAATGPLSVLDWGCGPGRIVRHLPEFMPCSSFYGTDYNPESIKWCSQNLKGICFSLNKMYPPLPFENSSFDIIYGISIFTHLSEKMHEEWQQELFRVTRSGGIILLTTQGNAFKTKLLRREKDIYDAGKVVVRGSVREGHRTYSAFQPPAFFNRLFSEWELLLHQEGKKGKRPQQDVWIFKKP